MRSQLVAVVETRFRPQRETIGQTIGGDAHRACSEPVHRIGLVVRARHQGCEAQLKALRGIALQDIAVERIVGHKTLIIHTVRADLRKHAALGRVRIDVIEVRKVGWIFQIAEGRNAVTLGFSALHVRHRRHNAAEGSTCGQNEDVPPARVVQERDPVLAACRRPTTRPSETRSCRISATWRAGRNDPARGANLAIRPLRNDVVVPQQHAVERLAAGNQLLAILGEDQLLDQRIHGRVLDADEVARSGLIRRLRTPEAALLIAGESD